MTGASKILTVSYGTFSCTLEGFDDPFNTMKAIAEYFRDLAAEDRYFGAEPPTPDAAMLHKIAEREIQRRVEAKIQDNGVILRAQDDVAPKVSFPSQRVQPEPAAAPAPTLATAAEAAPAIESAAARLSRLRAAQAHAAPAMAPILSAPADLYADIYPEDSDSAGFAAPEPEVAEPEPAAVVADRPAAKKQPVAKPAKASPAKAAPKPKDDADKAAAKEARKAKKIKAEPEATATPIAPSQIEDVLANISKALASPEVAQDQGAETLPVADLSVGETQSVDKAEETVAPSPTAAAPDAHDPLATSIRETLAGIGDADDHLSDAPSPVASDDLTEEPAADSADAIAAPQDVPVMAAQDQDYLPETDTVLDEDDPADAPATQGTAAADFDDDIDDAIFNAAFDGQDHAMAATEPTDLVEAAQPQIDLPSDTPAPVATLPAEAAEPVADTLTQAAAAVEPPQTTPSEKIQRARARVIKIRRLDTAPVEAAAPPPPAEPVSPPVLTAQDEADLQNELAALEAELSSPEPRTDPLPEAAPAKPAGTALAEVNRLPAAETDDASVNRLLQKANSELEVPETKRRRSAIAHLKAAVLATVAERRGNPNAGAPDTQRLDTYRKDLNQVMRPAPSERPAPLVLVSSQRIDRKPDGRPAGQPAAAHPTLAPMQPAPVQPVRPRRVSTGLQAAPTYRQDRDAEEVTNIFADPAKQSFAEFAERLGATSLHDVIEAAGAYCTLVLGRDSFTRPELFQQIASISGQPDLSREDGLRGFGRLLRDGRLTKTKRGEYALAETSPILNEARRRAG